MRLRFRECSRLPRGRPPESRDERAADPPIIVQ